MFLFSRINIPLVSLGVVQETGFVSGDTAAWANVFVLALRAERATGAPIQGRVRIAENMIARVIGSAVVLEQPVQLLVTLSTEFDGLQIWADTSLSDDRAILE
jgi:hypothetical protein